MDSFNEEYKIKVKSYKQQQIRNYLVHLGPTKKQQFPKIMQPLSQSIDQTSYVKMLSPSEKFVESIDDKFYSGATFKQKGKQSFQAKESTPNAKQQNLAQLSNYEQSKSGLPQLLDMNKTQQTRQRHATLKHTMESTIQQLLRVYKNRNTPMSPQQQQGIKNEIFQRFAFIFTQMNEVKGDIQNTINFLNQGTNISPIDRQSTPTKKFNLLHAKITQKSQSFQESSSMKQEQNDQKQYEEQSQQNYDQASLEQRYQERPNQNSMEPEE